MGRLEVDAFPGELAVERSVSATTQTQVHPRHLDDRGGYLIGAGIDGRKKSRRGGWYRQTRVVRLVSTFFYCSSA